jgi:WD40 repeat protein/mono/diheme cytochrome c family protein
MRTFFATLILIGFCAPLEAAQEPQASASKAVTYAQARAVFTKHCLSCHDSKEAEGQFVMETHESLMKGGENGPAVIPGKAAQSPLVKQIEHREKPFMPPPRKGKKLSDEEIALVRGWIDAGAPGPLAGEGSHATVTVPKIEPKVPPRKSVAALAWEPKAKLLAVAKADVVELLSADGQAVVRALGGHSGNVNDLAFSADGTRLAAAAGQPGTRGEVRVWNVADGALVRTIEGHKDAIYAVAISPDGKTLATGSYDEKVQLWELETGKPLRELAGHNGAVFDLSFRSDGKVLASASADRTLKLWDVETGKRLDTRPESLKELHSAAFSPDGRRVAAAGVDNRIRLWQVSAAGIEGSNPLLVAQFAHEGAILRLAWSADGKTIASSADDRTVKLWDATDPTTLKPGAVLPTQPDWPSALAFAQDDKVVAVGRLDGSLDLFDARTGKPVPPPKPELADLEPNALQRGNTVKLKLTGKGLAKLTAVRITGANVKDKLTAKVVTEGAAKGDVAVVEVVAAADLATGTYDLSVSGPGGESAPLKLYVDDLPQAFEAEPNDAPSQATAVSLPASAWGELAIRGDRDHFAFDAEAGRTVVLDVAARRLASKADVVLAVLDASGRILATANGHGDDPDPLLAFTPPSNGRYVARVTDLMGAASPQHFYRVSIGTFPYVTGVFPLGVPASAESTVHLLGHNLPPAAGVKVKAPAEGELDVPLDAAVFRSRRPFKLAVGSSTEVAEHEPNDGPQQATALAVPGAASGRIASAGDSDLFRIEAQAGVDYIIETQAARRGSPADAKVEVLHADGRPVQRVQLRAIRDSYINFRGIDANNDGARFQNWEEMDLNQYMYMSGEVVKLFLAPRGPDSDFNVYKARKGLRRCYFDTTATAHALDERTYIVEPHPPGATFPPNGLPVFTLNYVNDDDAERELGSDSRLTFTAPQSGTYLVRVTDTRSFGGGNFTYRLVVRQAKPDFKVVVESIPSIPAGSGRGFNVKLDRIDGFDGPVRVDVSGAPPGFVVSSPVVVEAGHDEARGTIYATGAPPPPDAPPLKLTAKATIDGKEVSRPVKDIAKLTVAPKPPITVTLEPMTAKPTTAPATAPATQPTTRPLDPPPVHEITIAPGQMVPAHLRIERNGFKERVSFDVDNLPHGVIVADIGLNGVLIPEGQTERQIFLHCAPWVQETDRLCHAKAREAGNPTSLPVLLKVRKPPQQAAR